MGEGSRLYSHAGVHCIRFVSGHCCQTHPTGTGVCNGVSKGEFDGLMAKSLIVCQLSVIPDDLSVLLCMSVFFLDEGRSLQFW